MFPSLRAPAIVTACTVHATHRLAPGDHFAISSPRTTNTVAGAASTWTFNAAPYCRGVTTTIPLLIASKVPPVQILVSNGSSNAGSSKSRTRIVASQSIQELPFLEW